MTVYNEESLIISLEELFMTNYNNYITEINNEKSLTASDPLFLSEIPATKYVFESISPVNKTLIDFFIVYGLMENDVSDPEQYPIRLSVVSFQVAFFDSGIANRRNIFFKLIRYREAMMKLINDNKNVFQGYSNVTIDKLLPKSFAYDKDTDIITSGVNIGAKLY